MQLIAQLFFGWPAIVLFLVLATLAAWLPDEKIMLAALFLSLGPSLYIFGGTGWIQLLGIYIPLSLGVSILLIKYKKYLLPKVLLIPMYIFYILLGYAVYMQ